MLTYGLACAWIAVGAQLSGGRLEAVKPADGQTIESFLTVELQWVLKQPAGDDRQAADLASKDLQLTVSEREDMSHPVVDVRLPVAQTGHRMAVRPATEYFWQVALGNDSARESSPAGSTGRAEGLRGSFTTGSPRMDTTTDDAVRYRNPRPGAHYQQMNPVAPQAEEPLSPWFSKKRYHGPAPPKFEEIEQELPRPVFEGHPDALAAYWHCWKVLCGVWHYAPSEETHQAVSNIIGIRTWGPWGSTMVFDTAFILYFAKYAHQAYPFVEGFDNCYARQHENGFICRESDRENREVYVVFPVNPPLFAWAEWQYYLLSGDRRRMEAVFLPMVKHYEWWMIYQRRESGLYWTNGVQEADDSPRNGLMHYAVSATSYQALTAFYLAKIARVVDRPDMARFFDQQHRQLGQLVNQHFWDQEHEIYNDLAEDGRFITELEPGEFCKHSHMFWPLIAQIAPPQRIDGMVAELRNPQSFFRRNGVPSLSADSAGYAGGPEGTGQYWRGAVWPPIQCMVQEGLRNNGRRELARSLARQYSQAVVETFKAQGDITENLAPDRPLACGVGQFVGWGGIGPVANLIEYTLGFDINVPEKKVVWHINRTQEHGIRNLKLGSFAVDMICRERKNPHDPCQLTIDSGGPFTLIVITDREELKTEITGGAMEVVVK